MQFRPTIKSLERTVTDEVRGRDRCHFAYDSNSPIQGVMPQTHLTVAPLDHFSTGRLRAHRLERRDFDDLCRMHRDPEMMKTLGGLRSDQQTRKYLQANLDHWERYGFGLWILREAERGAVVGRSAIRHVDIDGQPEVEIGYALMPPYWGRGLATEVAKVMLELAHSGLRLRDVVALSLPDNVASRRVMEKSGGIHERDVLHGGHQHVLYRFRHGIAAT